MALVTAELKGNCTCPFRKESSIGKKNKIKKKILRFGSISIAVQFQSGIATAVHIHYS